MTSRVSGGSNACIDKNGRISYIEKAVKPATSAEDMIAKLGELSVSKSQ